MGEVIFMEKKHAENESADDLGLALWFAFGVIAISVVFIVVQKGGGERPVIE